MRHAVRPVRLGCLLGATVLTACVHDVVLPNQELTATCGNGLVEPGESCDVQSPGCVACVVAPTWTCTPGGCSVTCGDGVVSDGAGCSSPKRDTACGMTGYWAARQSAYLRETILGGIQVSSNWFFFRLVQDGDAFRVLEALDCGILVTGNATVRYTPASLRAIIHDSGMDGTRGRPARAGVSRVAAGGCAVSFDRWYAVRGLAESFLPADFLAKPELSSLPKLPTVPDPAVASGTPEGAVDADGDGAPGLAFRIDGIAAGIRNSAQRDWKEFALPAGSSLPASTLTFDVPGSFDLQESVLRVTECGSACGFLSSVARPAQEIPARMTFAYLGRDLAGPRVSQVAMRTPGVDLGDDLATCANVRLLLPHDPAVP
ncbi:MAG TPA: hypothetical protein VLT33_42055 [Labilithrix sp.]|nr:hypothetical protein [Labilithrix sp.]